MIRVRRRGTTQSIPLVLLATLVASLGLVPLSVGAQTIAQTKAEISQLSATLSQQEKTSEITANEYDTDKANLQAITNNIYNLEGQVQKKRQAIAVTSVALQTAVVKAYVLGASAAQIESLFNQNVTQSDARQVYQDQVIGNLNQIKATYEAEKKSLDTTISQVAVQRQKAQEQTNAMSALLAENIRNENSTRATLESVTAKYRSEIIAYEITQGIAAAKAKNLAGETAAIDAAAAVGGQSAANQVTEAIQAAMAKLAIAEVAGSAQGLAALKYAESQIGVPYVWGGETPGQGFDCSGLVQWAWGKAGIAIPRTTETQWPALVHVPLTALQPGDLLFYYNLDGDYAVDHVVMYAGSGPWGVDTIIAAAHTGTNVSLAPLFTSGLIGAARP
jgi:peptidoglycan DL-endopeptidase CwlO